MHPSGTNTCDIVDTLLSESGFHSLLGALKAANLVDYLKGSGPLTLFAPTDDAFVKLPAGTLLNLEKPANQKKLQQILKSHIVKGRHEAHSLRHLSEIETAAGVSYPIVADGAGIRVGTASLLGSEIACSDGVIHVVDSVLSAD